jgi:rhodanese-related sulfurtransferase
LATKSLNELGYVNAVNMNGGLKAWMKAGYPVEKTYKKGFTVVDKY